MIGALLLAATAAATEAAAAAPPVPVPAPLEADRFTLSRAGPACANDCTVRALLLPAVLSAQPTAAAGACLLNPILSTVRIEGPGSSLRGVLVAARLVSATGKGAPIPYPLFLVPDTQGDATAGDRHLCVRDAGSLHEIRRNIAKAGLRFDGADADSGLTPGLGNPLGGMFGSFANMAAGSGVSTSFPLDRIRARVMDRPGATTRGAASPASWLLGLDSLAVVRILVRSRPTGAELTLDGAASGLTTDRVIAMNPGDLSRLRIRQGARSLPIAACAISFDAGAEADAKLSCRIPAR